MPDPFPLFDDGRILALRPERVTLDPRRPYAYFVEDEYDARGRIVRVATVFLTNRECPYRCLMCDLWKNTLNESVAPGDIPEQIRFALEQLGPAEEIKLYNSGNFFDRKAIPAEDYAVIAELTQPFRTVIVENHPKLCGSDALRFRDLIAPSQLEIALGLETCHPRLLASLNKGMTLGDFDRAAEFLRDAGIRLRAFLLLRPPFLSEAEGVEWCLRSIEYAFDRGVACCSVIPTRGGNGIMEQLANEGRYAPPAGASLERVLEAGLALDRGRVFVDLWDAGRFFRCDACRTARLERLQAMNLEQRFFPRVVCTECGE